MLFSMLLFPLIFVVTVSGEYGCGAGMDRIMQETNVNGIKEYFLNVGSDPGHPYEITIEGCAGSSNTKDIWLKLYDPAGDLVESCDDCKIRGDECDDSHIYSGYVNARGDLEALPKFGIYKLVVDGEWGDSGSFHIELFCDEYQTLECKDEGENNPGVSGQVRIQKQLSPAQQVDSGREHIYYNLCHYGLPFDRTYTVSKTGNIRLARYHHGKYRTYELRDTENANGEIVFSSQDPYACWIQVAGPAASGGGAYDTPIPYTVKCQYIPDGPSAASVPMDFINQEPNAFIWTISYNTLYLLIAAILILLLVTNIYCMIKRNNSSFNKKYKKVVTYSDSDIDAEAQQLK